MRAGGPSGAEKRNGADTLPPRSLVMAEPAEPEPAAVAEPADRQTVPPGSALVRAPARVVGCGSSGPWRWAVLP
jgi:hypothetical protein